MTDQNTTDSLTFTGNAIAGITAKRPRKKRTQTPTVKVARVRKPRVYKVVILGESSFHLVLARTMPEAVDFMLTAYEALPSDLLMAGKFDIQIEDATTTASPAD